MSQKINEKKESLPREEMPFPLGKPPPASSETVSRVMHSIKRRGTTPEISVRKALWESGIRGYRVNSETTPGRPDICFIGKKVAIFINGCFWHRCPHCNLSLPKTNSDFWQRKFERNILRDKLKTERLQDSGWQVITLWECDIKKDIDLCVRKIIKALNGQ